MKTLYQKNKNFFMPEGMIEVINKMVSTHGMCLAPQYEDRWMKKHLSLNRCILLTKSGKGVIINSAEVISVEKKETKFIRIWSKSDSFVVYNVTKESFIVRIKTDKKTLSIEYNSLDNEREETLPEIKISGCEYKKYLEVFQKLDGTFNYVVYHQKRGYNITPENYKNLKIKDGIAYPSEDLKESYWQIGNEEPECFESAEEALQKYPGIEVFHKKDFIYEGNDHMSQLWKNNN